MNKKDVATVGIDKDWQAASDLRTCKEAMEVRKDAARWKAVQGEAKKQKQALSELGDDTYSGWKAKKRAKA